MIDFQRPDATVKEKYHRCLADADLRGCEYSFANLNLWGRQRIAFLDDFAVIFAQFQQSSVYPYPVGKGDVRKVLDRIIQDARARGIPCRMTCLSEENCRTLEQLYPGQFRFHADRDSYDYIYQIEELAWLKGKRMQSKRNFVNRFHAAHPDCQILPLDAATLPATQEMVELWYENRVAENPLSDYYLEQVALNRAFARMQELDLEGIVLMEHGQVLAMTMGSPMTPTTFDVHFEKALDRVDGAYAAVNCAFARYLLEKYPDLKYLNREDDMGLPGLRKAKLSYRPYQLLEQYWARLWEDDDEN